MDRIQPEGAHQHSLLVQETKREVNHSIYWEVGQLKDSEYSHNSSLRQRSENTLDQLKVLLDQNKEFIQIIFLEWQLKA